MAHVLVVHDSETVRSDLARALMGEGFTVVEADSASSAVRELWQGTFDAALAADKQLEEQLKNLAPEIVTMTISKEPPSKLAHKLAVLLEGGEVAA